MSRLELQTYLEALFATENVYFQPPSNVNMTYPAVVYNLDDVDIKHADNFPYSHKKGYSVTIIDKDPDSSWPDLMLDVPTSRFQRHFSTDGLNHYVYIIYF